MTDFTEEFTRRIHRGRQPSKFYPWMVARRECHFFTHEMLWSWIIITKRYLSGGAKLQQPSDSSLFLPGGRSEMLSSAKMVQIHRRECWPVGFGYVEPGDIRLETAVGRKKLTTLSLLPSDVPMEGDELEVEPTQTQRRHPSQRGYWKRKLQKNPDPSYKSL